MFRGTTPTNRFEVEVDLTTATAIYITYKQGNTIAFEYSSNDIVVTSNSLTVTLTQQDTLKLVSGKEVQIQIRAKFSDGTAIASNIIHTTADEILKDGAI